MEKQIQNLLQEEYIDAFGILPLEEVDILRPSLMPEGMETVIMLAIPYDNGAVYSDGVSSYAHVSDYHKFFRDLFARMLPRLASVFPGKRFYGFSDHSPISEKSAAAKAGLGVIGKQSLLIHPQYGSYLFLGEIITDLKLPYRVFPIQSCISCGACAEACPTAAINKDGIDAEKCLSALSQKKSLTAEELDVLRSHGIAWGCDHCQACCPYNQFRTVSSVPFFVEHRHGDFSAQEIEEMSEEGFRSFAFSWRGRKRILENLYNCEKLDEQGEKTNKLT